MKKLLIMISIIIACVTISTCSLATTTLKDVKGTKYEEAVNALIEVGLVNGYPEDNTYRPNVVVTRAQMSKMMVVALGEESKVTAAAKKKSVFTDLKEEHWAYGYINVAKDLGIIVGYTDGSFAPDATVTYAEATTMAIRALGYEDEVAKSTESWPTNYTSYAKKLNLYDSIGTFNNNSGAKRGDVANLLWNMLRTGVCSVTGQSTNGGLTYGQGQKMINKYKNYVYLDGAMITSVTFNDSYSKATVKMADNKDSLSVSLTASEVLEYYAKKLDVLYNTSSKSIFSIDYEKEYKEVKGSITKIKSGKIYFDDDYYTLPSDSNILLYKVDKLSEAIDATLYMSGSTVKYVLASGAKQVNAALVTDKDVTIDSSKDGIKIKKLGSSTKSSYVLIDKSDMPAKESIILYYLNSDDELGIIKEIKLDDAKAISKLTSSQIKVGSTTYTYDSDTFAIYSATSSAINNLKFSKIVKAEDMVYAYEYAGTTYLVVFIDSVESETAVATAKKELQNYVTSVDGKYAEANYSQATWYKYYEALTSAKTLLSSSSPKASKMNIALTDLKTAVSELKQVWSGTDKRIAEHRANIRILVNGKAATIVSEKSKYTTDSYKAFYEYLTTAKDLLARTDTTETETKKAYENLNNAITNGMKLVKDTDDHIKAVNELNSEIASAEQTVKSEANYTATTWSNYTKALNEAKDIKDSSDNYSTEDIKKVISKLKNAVKGLKSSLESLRYKLNDLIISCQKYESYSGDYMSSTYSNFTSKLKNAYDVSSKYLEIDISQLTSAQLDTALKELNETFDDLKKAKEGLVTVSDALKNIIETVSSIKECDTTIKDTVNSTANTTADQLKKISNIETAVKNSFASLIASAESKTDKTSELYGALATATALKSDAPLSDVVTEYKKLYNVLDSLTAAE